MDYSELTYTISHFKSGSINYLIYHGPEREDKVSNVLKHAIVITTYDTLKADCPNNLKRKSKRSGLLHSIEWYRVVLDEGKLAKCNAESQSHSGLDSFSSTRDQKSIIAAFQVCQHPPCPASVVPDWHSNPKSSGRLRRLS